jgi:hypothetical protein
MNKNKVIYSLSIEDILNVMEENNMKINLNENTVKFIQDKVGDIINWRESIEFALLEYKNKRKYSNG